MRKVLKNKRVLRECHIYAMLKTAAKNRHISFHTPGHKRGKWDITELDFSDNLAAPRGCIARAQTDIARILGANAAFISTDGSTAGVLSMFFSAKILGAKRIAIPDNAHKSVWNACALFDLSPTVISTRKRAGIPQALQVSDFEGAKVDALCIASPDYYGNIPDLAAFRAFCDRTNTLLLIDGAHGGHLHFDRGLYAGAYADVWVDGVHKSLPAFTQGAVVCARTEKCAAALEKGAQIFRTTSPSYPVMASVEYAVKYPRNDWLENAARLWQRQEARLYAGEDWTKLCFSFGENADKAWEALQKTGIYAEFCDGNVILCYLSPATEKRAFLRLKKQMTAILKKYPYAPLAEIPAPLVLQKTGETEWIKLTDAAGRICAESCGLFPPCTPLIARGERISEEKIRLLERAENVFGIKEDKISVFQEENEE